MRRLLSVLTIVISTAFSFNASAVLIGGVDFPQGLSSFADAVSDYTPGAPLPATPYQGAVNALGAPDYSGSTTCADQASCEYVSLGSGGSLVFQFIDNLLTGSGDTDLDLWIFEIGPDVEDTFVEVSTDGAVWIPVGKVFGATNGIDIDAFGFTPASVLSYVRLTDDPNEGGTGGATPGADIDAIGAITTRIVPPPIPTPEPSVLLLLGAGLIGFRLAKKR
jgi:hypothetical protein